MVCWREMESGERDDDKRIEAEKGIAKRDAIVK